MICAGDYARSFGLDPDAALRNGHAELDATGGMLPVYEGDALLAPMACPQGVQAEQAAAASLMHKDQGAGAAAAVPVQGMPVAAYSVNL